MGACVVSIDACVVFDNLVWVHLSEFRVKYTFEFWWESVVCSELPDTSEKYAFRFRWRRSHGKLICVHIGSTTDICARMIKINAMCCGNEEKKKRVARTRTWHNWNLSVLNWIFCAHCSREIGVVYSFMICIVSSKGNKTLFSLWNLVSHLKYVCLYDVNIWRCVLLEYYNSKWILISLLAYLVEYNRTKSGGKWTMNNGVAP